MTISESPKPQSIESNQTISTNNALLAGIHLLSFGKIINNIVHIFVAFDVYVQVPVAKKTKLHSKLADLHQCPDQNDAGWVCSLPAVHGFYHKLVKLHHPISCVAANYVGV